MSSPPTATAGASISHTHIVSAKCAHAVGKEGRLCGRKPSTKCKNVMCATHCKLSVGSCGEHPSKSNQLTNQPTTIPYATIQNTMLPMPPTTSNPLGDHEEMDWETQMEFLRDPLAENEMPSTGNVFATNAAMSTSNKPITPTRSFLPLPPTLPSTSQSETSGDRAEQRVRGMGAMVSQPAAGSSTTSQSAVLAPKLSRQLNGTWLGRQLDERSEEQASQLEKEALRKEREQRLQWEFVIKFWDEVRASTHSMF